MINQIYELRFRPWCESNRLRRWQSPLPLPSSPPRPLTPSRSADMLEDDIRRLAIEHQPGQRDGELGAQPGCGSQFPGRIRHRQGNSHRLRWAAPILDSLFILGYQPGCQSDVSSGLQRGANAGISPGISMGSSGVNAGVSAGIGGFVQTILQPGVIVDLPLVQHGVGQGRPRRPRCRQYTHQGRRVRRRRNDQSTCGCQRIRVTRRSPFTGIR
jgi:hypothetical protein